MPQSVLERLVIFKNISNVWKQYMLEMGDIFNWLSFHLVPIKVPNLCQMFLIDTQQWSEVSSTCLWRELLRKCCQGRDKTCSDNVEYQLESTGSSRIKLFGCSKCSWDYNEHVMHCKALFLILASNPWLFCSCSQKASIEMFGSCGIAVQRCIIWSAAKTKADHSSLDCTKTKLLLILKLAVY